MTISPKQSQQQQQQTTWRKTVTIIKTKIKNQRKQQFERVKYKKKHMGN